MATIEKRPNGSYLITVSTGYNSLGKQIRHRMTIPADDLSDLTERQILKAVNEKAVLFEKKVKDGKLLDGEHLTLSDFVERWLKDYATLQYAPKTLYENKKLLDLRILPALGHMWIGKIKPAHLVSFYNNLAENGIRLDSKFKLIDTATPIPEIISKHVRDRLASGLATRKDAAVRVADSLNTPFKSLFIPAEGPRPLSDKTIKNYHELLSTIFTVAVQWQIVEDNPCTRVKPPKTRTKSTTAISASDSMHVLDSASLRAMLAALEKQPLKYHVIIMIALITGCRLGEIMGLTWNDIDLQRKIIQINKASQHLPRVGNYIKAPKTDSSVRRIAVTTSLIELLEAFRNEQLSDIGKMGDLWEGAPLDSNGLYYGRLFVKLNGLPMYTNHPSKWFRIFLADNNLPHIRFHDLRHLSGSILISEGVDALTVSRRLGHAQTSTTLNIYGHVLEGTDSTAADTLDKHINQ